MVRRVSNEPHATTDHPSRRWVVAIAVLGVGGVLFTGCGSDDAGEVSGGDDLRTLALEIRGVVEMGVEVGLVIAIEPMLNLQSTSTRKYYHRPGEWIR